MFHATYFVVKQKLNALFCNVNKGAILIGILSILQLTSNVAVSGGANKPTLDV